MRADRSAPFITFVASAAAVLLAAGTAGADTSDPWITTKAKMALLTDAEAPALGVNVDTVGGEVTLQGTVASEAEKARVEKVVRGVEGVREVRNMLRVDPAAADEAAADAEVADDELEKRVKSALDGDRALSKSDIDVRSVKDGVVTLGGKAKTMTEHRRALEEVREVPGVEGVRSEVQAPTELTDAEVAGDTATAKAGADANDGGPGAAASDMWITTATKVRLMANEQTPALDINVDTRDGEVTLFGAVPTEAAKEAAAAEAKKVDGVTAVHNRLEVVPENMKEKVEAKDDELEAAVESELGERSGLERADIDVEVSNGVARLTGKVESQAGKLDALTTARSVPGVRAAIDDLEVGGAQADADAEAEEPRADSDRSDAESDAATQRELSEGNRPAADAYDDDAHNDAGDAPLR